MPYIDGIYHSELLNCEEYALLVKARKGISNNQNNVKVTPEALHRILESLDRYKISAEAAESALQYRVEELQMPEDVLQTLKYRIDFDLWHDVPSDDYDKLQKALVWLNGRKG